jgi:hypothetical protein
LKKFKMNRLIVDDDAIEIKNHGPQHELRLQKSSFTSTDYALEEKYGIRA